MLLLGLVLVAPASAAAPAPTGFSPTGGGPAGTTVTISGTFTAGAATVTFNGVTAFGTTTATATQIVAVVPPLATTGPIEVTDGGGGPVTVPGGNFTVTALPAPTVTSFTPLCGPATTVVTLTGTNLIGVKTDAGFVKFNGVAATTVTILSNTQVQAQVPATATGPITVRSDAAAGESGSTATGPYDFTVAGACTLDVTGINPSSGPVGTTVTITGTNFPTSTTCPVTFSSHRTATGTTNSAGTQLTVSVPSNTVTGTVLVSCSTGADTTSFTVTTTPAPTITSFTPTYGAAGKVVTITGTNFSGTGYSTTSVKFNNVTSTFSVTSATQITATVPNTATTGKITVTTPGGTATSTTDFIVSVVHSRTVALELHKHLIAKGNVSAGTFSACSAAAEVKIQRKGSGGNWKTVDTGITSSSGSFKIHVNDREGRYRALASKVVLGGGANICSKATSPTRKHNH